MPARKLSYNEVIVCAAGNRGCVHIAEGEQSSLEGTMNLPECSN